MNRYSAKTVVIARYAGAAVGGLLLSAAFPRLSFAGGAWVAPGLILFCALGTRGAQAFRIGFVGGLFHFLSSLYWLLNMPFTWHGIPLAPALGWFSLSAYCALFPAVWVWQTWNLFPATPRPSVGQFVSASWLDRQSWFVMSAALWTVLEYVRGILLTGFPWNFVGASQFRMTPVIQIAAFTGIYGVSFIVVWTSIALTAATLMLVRKPGAQTMWTGAGIPLLTIAGLAAFGVTKLVAIPTSATPLSVAMIQPGIPQTEIWDSSRDAARFKTVLDLSEKALKSKARLLLWPESAVPDLTPEIQESIGRFAQTNGIWLAFCSGTVEPKPDGATGYYNSALLCSPEGALESIYHKRRLVIFGEYIPLVRWLPFLKWLTPVGDGLDAGERAVPFAVRNPAANFSVLICFEDMFAAEAREHCGPDTDFLVNLTNDGWFGHADEQWQQAATSVFRAVENGVPILRCTNDGLTCWADAQGRLRQILGYPGDVYGPGFLNIEIPLGEHHQTVYNRYGDWFPWGCAIVGLVGIFRARAFPKTGQDTVQK